MSGKKGNKKYRDSVFRGYFNEPVRLLSLCNAILDTRYSDVNELKINTLEGIFFDNQKNDISCTIGNTFLVLVEHQTSVNENMPFRCLSYVTELLNNLVTNKKKLYNKLLIRFPVPRFVVLYDGERAEPLKREMRYDNVSKITHCFKEDELGIKNNYSLVQNSYAALWREYKEVKSAIALKRVMRHILEHYFIQVSGYQGQDLHGRIFKDESIFDDVNGIRDTALVNSVNMLLQYVGSDQQGFNAGFDYVDDTEDIRMMMENVKV